MPRPRTRGTAAAGLFIAALALGASGPAHAAGCTLATLKGTYVYALEGFKTTGDTAASRVPIASAGRDVYRGDGTVQGVDSTSVNGTVQRGPFKGTYTLASDCSGSVTLTDSSGATTHWDIYVLDSGAAVSFVQADPGMVASGVERRQ
jgi:hypothetical protein